MDHRTRAASLRSVAWLGLGLGACLWLFGGRAVRAADACLPVAPTDFSTIDTTVRWRVRGAYLTPTDRPFPGCLRERLDTWVRIAQRFFREEMALNGYRDASGQGKTFRIDTGADGLWNVVFLVGEHDTAWYQANYTFTGGWPLREMSERLPPEFNYEENVVVYMYDTAAVVDERLKFSGQVGGGSTEAAGFTFQGAHFLGIGFDTVATNIADQAALFEDTASSGVQEWDGLGSFHLLTRGEYASTYVGAATHELGHAFGVMHHTFDDYDGDGIENNLMGHGFRRISGRYTPLGYHPYTQLGGPDASLLDQAAMFLHGVGLSISRLTPDEALPGDIVVVEGEGFAEGDTFGTMDPSVVLVDGEPAETSRLSARTLTFVVPPGLACGPHEVRVRNRPISDPPTPAVESEPVTLAVSDREPPSLACPPDVRVTAAPGATSATVAYPAVSAADACDPSPAVTFDPPPDSELPAGKTEVLCTAADSSGNTATCSFAAEVRVNAGSVGLCAEPDPVVLDGGARAVGFAGRLEAGPHCEDLRWTRALFHNVGTGDAAGLCRQARLFRDVDGDGALDDGDEPLGSPATFTADGGALEMIEPDLVLSRGSAETFFLVLDLEARASAAPLGAGCTAVVLCAAIALDYGRRRRDLRDRRLPRDRRWTALPVVVLGLALLSPSCGGGGGGGTPSAPAGSRSLQLRLEAATFRGVDSGQECDLGGLPITGWTIRL